MGLSKTLRRRLAGKTSSADLLRLGSKGSSPDLSRLGSKGSSPNLSHHLHTTTTTTTTPLRPSASCGTLYAQASRYCSGLLGEGFFLRPGNVNVEADSGTETEQQSASEGKCTPEREGCGGEGSFPSPSSSGSGSGSASASHSSPSGGSSNKGDADSDIEPGITIPTRWPERRSSLGTYACLNIPPPHALKEIDSDLGNPLAEQMFRGFCSGPLTSHPVTKAHLAYLAGEERGMEHGGRPADARSLRRRKGFRKERGAFVPSIVLPDAPFCASPDDGFGTFPELVASASASGVDGVVVQKDVWLITGKEVRERVSMRRRSNAVSGKVAMTWPRLQAEVGAADMDEEDVEEVAEVSTAVAVEGRMGVCEGKLVMRVLK